MATKKGKKGTTCVVCYAEPVPTTRTAFRGSMKYLKLALTEGLGIEEKVADSILTHSKKVLKPTNNPNTAWGAGKPATAKWYEMCVTLCPACAERLNFRLGTEAEGMIPCYEEAWK